MRRVVLASDNGMWLLAPPQFVNSALAIRVDGRSDDSLLLFTEVFSSHVTNTCTESIHVSFWVLTQVLRVFI